MNIRQGKASAVFATLLAIIAMQVTAQGLDAGTVDFAPRWAGDGVLRVSAASGDLHGEVLIPESQGSWVGDTWEYVLPHPMIIESGEGLILGRIHHLMIVASSAPQVSLNFLVVAGNSDTAFFIESDTMMFDPIPDAMGRASAGITVTDLNGDGVVLTGGFGGGTRSYRSTVNPLGAATVFADLVDNAALGSGGSITRHGVFPSPVGSFSSLSDAGASLNNVDSMKSAFSFVLSANDVAGGTSVFALTVPEPATIVGLCLPFLLLVFGKSCYRRARRQAL